MFQPINASRNRRAIVRGAAFASIIWPILSAPVAAHAMSNLSNGQYNPAAPACSLGVTILGDPAKIALVFWAQTISSSTDPNQLVNFDELLLSSSTSPNAALIGSQYYETLTQYYYFAGEDSNSGLELCISPSYLYNSFVGSLDVFRSAAAPPAQFTCAQEEALVDSAAAYEPANTLIVVQLSPGQTFANSCQPGYCAYHNYTSDGHPYVIIPYGPPKPSSGSCQAGVYNNTSQTLEHEVAELWTDSFCPSGWTSNDACGAEIGDYCSPNRKQVRLVTTVAPFPSTETIQSLWNNAANQGNGHCVFARPTGYSNFYLGNDGQIWSQQNDINSATAWGKPTYASNVQFRSAPAVASWGPYRFDLFAYDNNGHLGSIHQEQSGSVFSDDWGAPPSLSVFVGKPEVSSFGFGRLDLFATVNSIFGYVLLHRSWDLGTDSGWVELPAFPTTSASSPGAVSQGPSEIDVFILDSDGFIDQSTSTDGSTFAAWQRYYAPGGVPQPTGDPDVASWGPGRLDVFFVSQGGQSLTHLWEDINVPPGFGFDTWPVPSGYTLTGSPTATAMGDQRLKVEAVTTTGRFIEWMWDWGIFTYGPLTAGFLPQFNSSTAVPTSNNSLRPLGY